MSTLVFLVCLPLLILSNIWDRRDLKESDCNFLNLARTFHLFSLPKDKPISSNKDNTSSSLIELKGNLAEKANIPASVAGLTEWIEWP